MKASISVLAIAITVGVIGHPEWAMATTITYDFTGADSGDEALGASHTYTAAGDPTLLSSRDHMHSPGP
jgi:hypothetical protein